MTVVFKLEFVLPHNHLNAFLLLFNSSSVKLGAYFNFINFINWAEICTLLVINSI